MTDHIDQITETDDYRACASCKAVFDETNRPALFEDGNAFCTRCAYDASMHDAPTAA